MPAAKKPKVPVLPFAGLGAGVAQGKRKQLTGKANSYGGKRPDLGFYVRSRWEANWARYLEFLVDHGHLASWQYEPETYHFEGIRRGAIHYTPDFRVIYPDGRVEHHEVKGWMTSECRTKLKRMAKYHPTVVIRVIGRAEYQKVERTVAGVIRNWEYPQRA